ncbi:hypothetical protein VNI00_008816 [Paramarasmius palmivorus]|uniref:Uncharacterized protein n=1 Tax=Paramarasmius palmivorus TaxID=297713 RepID=A0AAW0CP79_9AGAR
MSTIPSKRPSDFANLSTPKRAKEISKTAESYGSSPPSERSSDNVEGDTHPSATSSTRREDSSIKGDSELSLSEIISSLTAFAANKETHLIRASQRIQTLEIEKTKIKEENDRVSASLSEKETQCRRLSNRVKTVEAERDELSRDLGDVKRGKDKLDIEVCKVRKENTKLMQRWDEEVKRLRSELDKAQASTATGSAGGEAESITLEQFRSRYSMVRNIEADHPSRR